MVRSSNAGRWHWSHWAVFFGRREMNCCSTTMLMMVSASLPPANSHLRHESRSCCAKTKGWQDGSSKVSIDQEVWDGQLLGLWASPNSSGITRTGQLSNQPPTCLRRFFKEVEERLRVIGTPGHLRERLNGARGILYLNNNNNPK